MFFISTLNISKCIQKRCSRCSCPFDQRRMRWHLSVSPTLLRSYPTGQVRRKESYCCAVRSNERQLHFVSSECKEVMILREGYLPTSGLIPMDCITQSKKSRE